MVLKLKERILSESQNMWVKVIMQLSKGAYFSSLPAITYKNILTPGRT